MRRLFFFVAAALASTLAALPALPVSAQGTRSIDVVEVDGLIDTRMVDFVIDEVTRLAGGSEVVVVQIDSAGALTDDVERLIRFVADPPVPLAVWVGPHPAVAYGGALQVVEAAQFRLAAQGVDIGHYQPAVAGNPVPEGYVDSTQVVAGPVSGLIDEAAPVLGAVVIALDGRTFLIDGQERVVSTTEQYVEGGETLTRPLGTVVLHEPDLLTRTLRLAARPEVAFLFLIGGLTVAAFEFYAAGVGVAAAVAVLSLWISGYGLAVLPVRWWAVVLALLGLGLYLFDFQRITLRAPSVLGTGALLAGGKLMVGGAPQVTVGWFGIVASVVAVALFFLFAMTTIVRARFSTPSIGRTYLIGRRGTARTAIAPSGIVTLDGADWKASARRASGIAPGDQVVVTGVDGIVLEVEPGKHVSG